MRLGISTNEYDGNDECMASKRKKIFFKIGSRTDNRFGPIRSALEILEKFDSTSLLVSVPYETEEDPSLLSLIACIELSVDLSVETLAFPDNVSVEVIARAHGETIRPVQKGLMQTLAPGLIRSMASLYPGMRYVDPGCSCHRATLAEIAHLQFPLCNRKRERFFSLFPELVGIVNVTPDSFSDGGRYMHPERAVRRIEKLAQEGASVIDIGGLSTRAGADILSWEEEWSRLEPVLVMLKEKMKGRVIKPKISLDSYRFEVAEQALARYPIDWINDVSGGKEPKLLHLVAESNTKIVLNHSVVLPVLKGAFLPFEPDPVSRILTWARRKILESGKIGIPEERIIIDPGIGFGKSPLQSLLLLRGINQLKETGCRVLIGHSKKAFLRSVSDHERRDVETLGLSSVLRGKQVDYLRVHDVALHRRLLTAASWLDPVRGKG